MDPALIPKMRSNFKGPSRSKASITPAVNAHRRLPPSRMRVSYVFKGIIGLYMYNACLGQTLPPQRSHLGQVWHSLSELPHLRATPALT